MLYSITGAAGFTGSNLTKRLLDRSHNVIGTDKLYYDFLRNIEFVKDERVAETKLEEILKIVSILKRKILCQFTSIYNLVIIYFINHFAFQTNG